MMLTIKSSNQACGNGDIEDVLFELIGVADVNATVELQMLEYC
jgi:hypothetical protein